MGKNTAERRKWNQWKKVRPKSDVAKDNKKTPLYNFINNAPA